METQLININERERDIDNLAIGVQEVSDLFSDMSILVHCQGEKLDNIEANIQSTSSSVDKANVQLIKAKKYQAAKRRCCIRIWCTIIGILIIFIFIILINNNLKN